MNNDGGKKLKIIRTTMNYKTITREELEVGDEVFLEESTLLDRGWYNVTFISTASIEIDGDIMVHNSRITGFRRKVEEQECERWLENYPNRLSTVDDLEQYLNETYGSPPIVYTYNGETAEQFDLSGNSIVLLWTHICWENTRFDLLCKGDKWMKQPKAPKQ